MKNHNGSPRLNHHQTANHTRDRNGKKGDWLSALWLRFSLRDYGFCMGTLLLFSLGSLFYQLNGGPPRLLLDMRQYLGKKTFLCMLKQTSCAITSYGKFVKAPSRDLNVSPGLSVSAPRSC